ncbi:hypothetical protein [Plantactinospora endophytica]|uniref:Uncharacterized protein n=1 Tax=Plantactinospora endophytica TaxID=673535 RepID=A0ABQ4DRM7_9ACTN|nr:hypothetical protein [Plantactinospora endophytica]GIG85105.1 hypothetical protein Pen02_00410 [Plantactinospora endophytica]
MDASAIIASLLCPIFTLITLGYLGVCAVSPFGACRRCHGNGRGRTYRHCNRCDGTGRRIRIGRHIWNEIRREHRNGTR